MTEIKRASSRYESARKWELGGGVVSNTPVRTQDPDFVNVAVAFDHETVERAKKIASERKVPWEQVLDEWRQAISHF